MMVPANAAVFALVGLLVLVQAAVLAHASYDTESWDRPSPGLYEPSLSPDEDFLLNYLRSRTSGSDFLRKRSRGMLDFGMTRGASGAKAAKARLGLKLANDPYGPGR